jgi:putative tryptophan/tyrosine transport system substrate-binding protein
MIRRRDFITLLGGAAAAWPMAARAQQPKAPVIGFLERKSARDAGQMLAAFHRGLNEAGFIESRNVAIEYRWAENHPDRLPMLAADLVQRKVAVIAAPDTRLGACSQGGDHDHSDCLQHQPRSHGGRSRCQPQPTRRQCYRHNVLEYRSRVEDCKSTYSTPAAVTRSTRHSRRWRGRGRLMVIAGVEVQKRGGSPVLNVRRRDFIALLGGAAAAWPLTARAQQAERVRRIGVLMALPADDPESPARVTAFAQGLQQLGWADGRDVRIDYRWGKGDADRLRRYAAELVALAPDVILATSSQSVMPLQQLTRTVPIVFVNIVDPVGAGFVESLARPGGNVTGFTVYEYAISAKWLELLKEIVPQLKRAAVLRDPAIASGAGQYAVIQAVAPSLGVELRAVGVGDVGEIERAITAFARSSNGGLIVTGSPLAAVHRHLIVTLAASHRLPAVYPFRYFTANGGLISYGPDTTDPFRRAAGYVDRILKGEKPADLPVQAPTKYDLVINLKTAKALGIEVPPTLIARADEVIE